MKYLFVIAFTSVVILLQFLSVEPLRPAFIFSSRNKQDPVTRRLDVAKWPCRDKSKEKQSLATQWMQASRGGASSSPKLSQWVGPALSSALSYASYNIFIKLGSASISPLLGGVILQTVAALLGTCLLGLSREKVTFDRKGILYSALAGVAVGAAELLSFQVSSMGVEASRSTPVMIGGSVAFGSLLGFVVLKERMTRRGWFGVFLVVAGIACVATDPGAKMGGH